jgi:hypothetical protein
VINLLFILGLLSAAIGQIIAYLGGPRTRPRFVATWFGISAVILLLAAGEMVAARFQYYLNSTNSPATGEGLADGAANSLVQQATPIAPATTTSLTLTFSNSTAAGNLITVEVYARGAPYVSSVSGMGCSLWTQVGSDNVFGVGLTTLYACNVVTPDTTVTISLPSAEVAGAAAQEFSGYQLAGHQSGHDSTTSTTSQASNLPSPKNANSLILIMMALSSNFMSQQITSPASPWKTLNSTNGANGLSFAQSYQLVSSFGAYSGTWSWPTSSNVVVVGGVFPATVDSSTKTP